MARDLQVEVRNKSLERLGTIPPNLLDFEMTLEHNDVGQWSVKMPTSHPMGAALAQPGSGIVVSVDGQVVFSGPTDSIVREATFINGVETIKATGVGDLTAIADDLAYPTPGVVAANLQTSSHDTRTGTPENLILAYINNNIGPSGQAARRNYALRLPATMNIPGTVITRKARFDNLLEFTSEIASVGGLRLECKQQTNGYLDFTIGKVVDQSTVIRLSKFNGLSQGTRVTVGAPRITRAVLAGQGDLTERAFVDATTTDSLTAETTWGRRITKLVDRRDLQDDDNLTADASDELTETGKTVVTANAVVAEEDWYGLFVDYNVGDYVAVEVDGTELKTQVRGAVIKSNADGVRFGLVLGEQAEKESEEFFTRKISDASAGVKSVQLRGGEARSVAKRYRTTTQSATSSTTVSIAYDGSMIDSVDATYGATAANGQPGWVINKSGVWNLTAMTTWSANSAGTRTLAVVTPNTTIPSVVITPPTTGVAIATLNTNVYLPAGTYVYFTATQTSGSTLTINGEAAGTSTFARLALVNK